MNDYVDTLVSALKSQTPSVLARKYVHFQQKPLLRAMLKNGRVMAANPMAKVELVAAWYDSHPAHAKFLQTAGTSAQAVAMSL